MFSCSQPSASTGDMPQFVGQVESTSTIAEENGLKGLANIILVGKLFKEVGFCSEETLDKALQKCIPARKASMLDFNRKAIEIGRAQ